ncbi:hypothetical protein K440DRAFT_536775 [Wilcoxina mikolae CBS 423.85]|nr:hypothetical protein K440DRAFT_536775 [Wilcoxina mikolae CBS 423.85]
MSSIPHVIGEDPRHNDLPGPSTLRHLIDAYFENVYSQTYAFLHRRTFIENIEKHPPVLLFSMCAVAARFSDYSSSEVIFASRARALIMENYDSYNLEVVQSMVHMGLHDFGSNNGHKAWMFAGMAVRMGAALNMNLENRKKDKNKNAISKECARRTYWSYYLMDRFNSYGVARPYLTQDHDCHIQLPCNQPSFTDGRYVITEHLLGPNPYYPEGGTKYMGAMAYLVRVVGIWGNILRQIHLSGFQMYSPGEMYSHSGHQSTAGTEFNDFIDKLEHWRKTLPSGLEYSNENLAGQIKVGTTGAFVMMHVMWHTAMAYVHRYVRTVGVPKDFIRENIASSVIVESIRKAFVHADAVLQIMCHVQQKKTEAKQRGEPPVTVNAPFLGQAISDACNITVIRALEVRGEPGGAHDQRHRVTVGVEWLRELKRYWKPIEAMYKKLKRTCRSLDRSSHPPSAHMDTPESSIDSGLAPATQLISIDPSEYTADPATDPTFGGQDQTFPTFRDFMTVVPTHFFGEAFATDTSQYHLNIYARNEGAFPELYPFSDHPLVSVSAPYPFEIPGGPSLGGEDMSDPMQMDHSTMVMGDGSGGGGGVYNILNTSEGCISSDDDDDDDDENGGSSERPGKEQDKHAIYFDLTAVHDGNLQDSSSSDTSGHSRRASEAATTKHDNNPMDVLNLINTDGIAARLQDHQNEPDEFTGPKGAAAPDNTEMGGQPNLDNSGGG